MRLTEVTTREQADADRAKLELIREQKAKKDLVTARKKEIQDSETLRPQQAISIYHHQKHNFEEASKHLSETEDNILPLYRIDINFLRDRNSFFPDFVPEFPKINTPTQAAENPTEEQKLNLENQQLDFILDYYERLYASIYWDSFQPKAFFLAPSSQTGKMMKPYTEIIYPDLKQELAGTVAYKLTNLIQQAFDEIKNESGTFLQGLAKANKPKSLLEFRIKFDLKNRVKQKLAKLQVEKELQEKKKLSREEKINEFILLVTEEFQPFIDAKDGSALGIIRDLWLNGEEFEAKVGNFVTEMVNQRNTEFNPVTLYRQLAIKLNVNYVILKPEEKQRIIDFLVQNTPVENQEFTRESLNLTFNIHTNNKEAKAFDVDELAELIKNSVDNQNRQKSEEVKKAQELKEQEKQEFYNRIKAYVKDFFDRLGLLDDYLSTINNREIEDINRTTNDEFQTSRIITFNRIQDHWNDNIVKQAFINKYLKREITDAIPKLKEYLNLSFENNNLSNEQKSDLMYYLYLKSEDLETDKYLFNSKIDEDLAEYENIAIQNLKTKATDFYNNLSGTDLKNNLKLILGEKFIGNLDEASEYYLKQSTNRIQNSSIERDFLSWYIGNITVKRFEIKDNESYFIKTLRSNLINSFSNSEEFSRLLRRARESSQVGQYILEVIESQDNLSRGIAISPDVATIRI